MTLLELILILVLQFEGICGVDIHLYYRPEDDAILPCGDVSSSDRVCSTVTWFYSTVGSDISVEFQNENVKKSAQAARMSLDASCSLIIKNITFEDAGVYTCLQKDKLPTKVFLSIMTILPSPLDADPKRDGNVTLECSLLRFRNLPPCRPDSIRWLDETGTVLRGEGDGYEFIGQTKCVSILTVKRQSGHNRRYTCQVVDERNKVQVEDHYTPVFTEGTSDDQSDKSNRGVREVSIYLYHRPGDDAILPCNGVSFPDRVCSTVYWLYNRNSSQRFDVVLRGKFVKNSSRAARMSLDTNCSLVINNITPEDAGRYTCLQKDKPPTKVYLNIMTIFPSPLDADPKRDGKVTLECSLQRYSKLPPCRLNSIRWLDETGTVLRGEGDGYKFIRQTKCVSILTVKRQSGHNRRYACQVVERNKVQVEDHYTPVFTDGTGDDQSDKSNRGISGADISLYYRPGDKAILPCNGVSSSDRVCSTVSWFYNRDLPQTLLVVQNGNVVKNSAQAARMSLDTNCSLVINNITADDVGRYTYRHAQKPPTNVFLSIMTIFPSPPDADPKRDDKVTLRCFLLRFSELPPCRLNSIRWVNETGTVLRGEGIKNELFFGLMKCVSRLTVKRQSGHNRRYTCQVLDERNKVQVEDHYTPVFIEETSDDQPDKPNTGWSPLGYVMLTLRIAGLLLIPVIVVLLVIKGRGNKTPPDQNNVQDDGDEVNYENVEATSAI